MTDSFIRLDTCNRYDESEDYNYQVSRPKNLKRVRNFTQLVWKDTTSMGAGMVVETDGKFYFVCSYDPAGNVQGEFRRNVLPPQEVRINKETCNSVPLGYGRNANTIGTIDVISSR